MNQEELEQEVIWQLQPFPAEFLVAGATGKVDLQQLAHRELSHRGLNATGQWVGFAKAEEIYKAKYAD